MAKRNGLIFVFIFALVIFCAAACSKTASAVKLAAPKGLALNGAILSWEGVSGAESYIAAVGETEYPAAQTQIELNFLTVPDTYSVKVKAVGDGTSYLDSEWSAELSYIFKIKIAAPDGFEKTDSELSWTSVTGAAGYSVHMNGNLQTVEQAQLDVSALEAGVYTIKVKALGDGISYTDSEWSEEVRYIKGSEGLTYSAISQDEYEVSAGAGISGQIYISDYYNKKPVTRVAAQGFKGRRGITSVYVPDSVTKICAQAFYDCGALTSVTLPQTLTHIEDYAFYDCIAMTSGSIPRDLVQIGNYAFAYCRGIPLAVIPSGVQRVGDYAFKDCSGLISAVLSAGVKEVGEGAFYNCYSLGTVSFSNSIELIGASAFFLCAGLKNIALPESLLSIGEAAFGYCSRFSVVTIPQNVTQIGRLAFSHCRELDSVTLKPLTPPDISRESFFNLSPSYKIYVPAASLNEYKTAWYDLGERIEAVGI